MREIPKEHEIYRHFKGNFYQIVAIAKHSETTEDYVVYKALYGEGKVWVRPLDMFMSEVDHEKYPEVTQTYRFEKEENAVDPGVMSFLDAETIDEKLSVLSKVHPRITDDMLTTMALSLDIELADGDTAERYEELKNCLTIRAKYESRRLRG